MSDELKPCPFCGGVATIGPDPRYKTWQVGCWNSDCILEEFVFEVNTKECAVRKWNTRATDSGTTTFWYAAARFGSQEYAEEGKRIIEGKTGFDCEVLGIPGSGTPTKAPITRPATAESITELNSGGTK